MNTDEEGAVEVSGGVTGDGTQGRTAHYRRGHIRCVP